MERNGKPQNNSNSIFSCIIVVYISLVDPNIILIPNITLNSICTDAVVFGDFRRMLTSLNKIANLYRFRCIRHDVTGAQIIA